MLAEHHYESLAVWALRSRVWDYLVKPFKVDEFKKHFDFLIREKRQKDNKMMWLKLLPSNRIPNQASIIGKNKFNHGTCTAISYMEAHLHEKISAEDVSKQCGLTRYELSRAFKSEFSLTFRDFLLKLRMSRAAQMLVYTDASVTDISLSVGFGDVSNFGRKFHQVYGCSPGVYRRNKKLTLSQKHG
jgi:AraC-like DNA-binding protein